MIGHMLVEWLMCRFGVCRGLAGLDHRDESSFQGTTSDRTRKWRAPDEF